MKLSAKGLCAHRIDFHGITYREGFDTHAEMERARLLSQRGFIVNGKNPLVDIPRTK